MKERKQIDVSAYQGYFDVQYSAISSSCKLDIFLPEGKGPFPVIVSIHGGAFKKCDKRDEEMILDMLHGLDKGYAVIGVNYRLSGEAQFPEPVRDIKQAINFIYKNSQKYQLEPNKIVVWGGSAGGYFTLMSGLFNQTNLFDQPGESYASCNVRGCIAWFPPVCFTEMDDQLKASGLLKKEPDHSSNDSPESLFLGAPITKNPELVQLANPETYINKDMPPMLIQHGRNDRVVPYQQSQNFVSKARACCGDDHIQYEILEGADHGDEMFSRKENLLKVYQFIENCFK